MIFNISNLDMLAIPKGIVQNLLSRDPSILRVYLYGLINEKATQKEIARDLGIEEGQVLSSMEILQEENFISLDIKNGTVTYLPFKADEEEIDINIYTDLVFNSTLEQFFGDRILNRKDYETFYKLIDTYEMDKDVVLILAEYCIKIYGNKVSREKIMNTAKAWKDEGIDSRKKANRKLSTYTKYYDEIKELLSMLSIKRAPTEQEISLYEKWIYDWKFTSGGIRKAMDATTGARNPSFKYLDGILKKLYQRGKLNAKDIQQYFEENEKLDDNIKEVLRALSYSNLSVSENQRNKYLSFIEKGFTQKEILLACAQGAGKNIDLDYVETVLEDWMMQGLLREEDIQGHLTDENTLKKKLAEIYDILGKKGKTSNTDLNLYRKFRFEYGFSEDIIKFAAKGAIGYASPLRSMNTFLLKLKDAGIWDLKGAEEYSKSMNKKKNVATEIIEHKYDENSGGFYDPRKKYSKDKD